MKILVENGLPGVALIGAYALSFAFVGLGCCRREAWLLGLLVTMTFALAFLTTEYQSKGVWFLAAGVGALCNP